MFSWQTVLASSKQYTGSPRRSIEVESADGRQRPHVSPALLAASPWRIDGPADGEAVIFANSLGTELRIWDGVVRSLKGVRVIRYDMRGHGLTVPTAPP